VGKPAEVCPYDAAERRYTGAEGKKNLLKGGSEPGRVYWSETAKKAHQKKGNYKSRGARFEKKKEKGTLPYGAVGFLEGWTSHRGDQISNALRLSTPRAPGKGRKDMQNDGLRKGGGSCKAQELLNCQGQLSLQPCIENCPKGAKKHQKRWSVTGKYGCTVGIPKSEDGKNILEKSHGERQPG